jgi:hypothetical protein
MGEFIIYFLGYLIFVWFFGAIFTRRDAYPGSFMNEGSYPETFVFWVLGLSGGLALLTVLLS